MNKLLKKVTGSLGSNEKILKNLLNGPYVYAVIVLIIGIYGPRLSPRLPNSVRDLFNNAFFRFVILTLVVYLSNKNLYVALIISISFVLLLNLANSLEVEEHFVKKYAENFSEFGVVLTENFEGDAPKTAEEEKTKGSVAAVEKPKDAAPTAPKKAEDFGDVSYRQGYSDGQEAQCPIGNTGGAAYSELDKVEEKTK